MNKLFKRGLVLLMGLVAATGAFAQMPQMMPELPIDSAVRKGTLPNGLTYYIRHNENPKGQADFYIAQKVGSILEEDHQRGLAHFLEHMCFNGTTNFPEKGIIEYLESIGVKFGYNLNARTGVDETIYNISSVPVARKSVQDSCLLILHDWSCDLTLDPKEIDAERGVIHEEWRCSTVGQMRIIEEQLPKIYPDSKYGYRLPIGTMEVVDNFPPQAIIDYYHTWYRPDQQAVIVVGDIDVDYIEGKIKEIFSPIKMPENPKERVYEVVEDTDGTIVAIGKDAEMSAPVALMFFKLDNLVPREMRNTQAYFGVKYITNAIQNMLNARLSDISNKPDSPFAQADVNIGEFFLAKTKDAVTLQVIGKDGEILPALEAAYREVLRALKGGFTPGEFERFNAELRSRYQNLYDSRNNTKSGDYSEEYVRAFVDNEPIPGVAMEKEIYDQLSQMMPLEAINQTFAQMISEDNRVIFMLLPDAEGFKIPAEQQVLDALSVIDEETLEPYRDAMKTEPLIPALPAAGKIASQRHLDNWDATEFTLSNGIRVVVKPTTFKDNEILFEAVARGGKSVLSDEYASSTIFLPLAMSKHGLGDYSNSDLQKYLQGKQVTVNFAFDEYQRALSGTSTVTDLPTLMELIYANFTEFNFTEEEFLAAQNMFKGVLANQESTPDFKFIQLVMKTLFKAPSLQQVSTAAIAEADRQTSIDIMKKFMSNAADYTFYFVGNIDIDTFKPLMEQYIATLPTSKTPGVTFATDPRFEVVEGNATTEESMAMATPQTWAFYCIGAKVDYTPANKVMTSMISQIMSKRLLNKVREEMGATYSIGAVSTMDRSAEMNTMFQIPFPMKPEMKDDVFAAVNTIIEETGKNVTPEELNPIKEYMVKEATAGLEENNAWLNAMAGTDINGIDTFHGMTDVINGITIENVQNFWNSILSQNNRQLIILNPAE